MKRYSLYVCIMMMAITLLTGCFAFITDLGDITGDVEFADTGLRLRSLVMIGSMVRNTSNGRFQIDLDVGRRYSWEVQTLLGQQRGTFVYNGAPNISLAVDAFAGWQPRQFNALLVSYPTGDVVFNPVTLRWPYNKTVNVWIETPGDNTNISEHNYQNAREALEQWEGILNKALKFRIVDNQTTADLTIHFVEVLPDAVVGKCDRYYDPRSGTIVAGHIEIARVAWEKRNVYIHEVGHCIGLNHSLDESHIMYEQLGLRNTRITDTEANYARLLYIIPPSAPLPHSAPFGPSDFQTRWHRMDKREDGIIVETIYDK